jgi:hypothetical protein
MTDLNKLKEIASMMFLPTRISGVVNLLAYPSPDVVKQSTSFPDKLERVEILMHKPQTAQALHTSTIIQSGKPTSLQVLPCMLSTPETCVICNRASVDQGVLEAIGPIKLTYGKMTIDGANASRVWDSIQRDRYWFTFPVCKDHLNDFHKKVFINESLPGDTLEIKLPHKAWGEQFIGMNQVDYATYKNEDYLRKFRWTSLLLYVGILGLALAITLAILMGDWFWIIPTSAMTIGGLILLFKNRFQVLVAESSSDPEGGNAVPGWLTGVISMKTLKNNITATGVGIAIIGVLTAFLKVNGNYLAWPWYIKAGIVLLGVLVFIVGSILGGKKKKKS